MDKSQNDAALTGTVQPLVGCEHEWSAIDTHPCRSTHWCRRCGTLRISHRISDDRTDEELYVPENKTPNVKHDLPEKAGGNYEN